MAEEYGEAVQIVLVEVQGADRDALERFALQREWLGTHAMWTTERPVRTGARGIPNYVLLSPGGEVVSMGNPMRDHSDIEDYVERCLRQRPRKPEDLPRRLDRAWKSWKKGDLGKALEQARRAAGRAAGRDPGTATAAQELEKEIVADMTARVDRLERMIEEGYLVEAEERIEDLADELEDFQDIEPGRRIAALAERLESDEMERELDAARDLRKVERALHLNGPSRAFEAKLKQLAEKHAGTIAGERAGRLARLL